MAGPCPKTGKMACKDFFGKLGPAKQHFCGKMFIEPKSQGLFLGVLQLAQLFNFL
jgi:hypothetical protein